MALGDEVYDHGHIYEIVWDGRRGSFSLLDPNPQAPSVFYMRSGHERKVTGSERKPHVRRVMRRSES